MASNDNNDNCKLDEEAESSVERKRLWLSDDDDNSSDSPEEETEEGVSSDESSMNQLDTSEEKLLAKHVKHLGPYFCFGN
jgi:hypothetical protein